MKVVVRTDATVYPHGRNAGEFSLLVDLGMKPIDALKAGTSLDAELLGVFDRTGSLEAGKWPIRRRARQLRRRTSVRWSTYIL